MFNEIKINNPTSLRIIKLGNNNWGLLANGKYLFADTYHSPNRPELDKYNIIYAQVDVDGYEDDPNEFLEIRIPEPSFGGGAPPEEIDAAYDAWEKDMVVAEKVLAPYSHESNEDTYYIKLKKIGDTNLIPTLDEIKINKPLNLRLKISADKSQIPTSHTVFASFLSKNNPWIPKSYLDKLPNSQLICYAQIYTSSNFVHLYVGNKLDSIQNIIKFLNIPYQILPSGRTLKISSKYYDIVDEAPQSWDPNLLDEIKINNPQNLYFDGYKQFMDKTKEVVIDILKDEIKDGFKHDIMSYYLDSSLIDVFRQFVIDQMIFNNYEVFKNGQEILVSYNNKNIINERDIIDYVNENINLKKYLKQLLAKFYYENVEIDEIINSAKNQVLQDKKKLGDDYNLYDVEYSVKDVIENYPYYFDDILYDETLKDFIRKEFLQADTINEIKTNKSFKESFLESIEKTIKTAIKNKTINPNNHPLIKEYSEKTITTTIERWKAADPNVDENVARQLIQRFDQIKSGLAQKLDIVVLPDELKKGNNYLNIDKYSFEDIVNLIRSLPENPEKVKKDAIKKFVEKEQIDRNTAQSYVARFIANRDKIKFGAKEGLEDEGFTKEEVLNYIPKRLQRQDAFLDPRNWDWGSFEQMLDALFPSQRKEGEGGENLVSTDADKVYDKNGIEIYKGDDVHKCISYNPVSAETKRKKYGWCVTQTGNTMYDNYRFKDKIPTFYFVFDRSKNSSPEHAPFDDQWHAFVIQVTADNKEYIVTGANNRGDISTKDKGWEGIADIVPADTWNKIKGLKDYFKPIGLSPVELGRKFASGKNLSVDEFKELAQDEKILYIQGKASKNQITPDILKILPQYKINLEGRSTTLANVAIDSRQKFPYSALKDNEALAKRYAVVSSRYYPNDPLPLPFIKYLDEDAKEKYLKKYDDNLTFEYIEKYFGSQSAEKYVNEQVKKLDYIPQGAFKYIKDPQFKKLYSVYSKLFDSWKFDSNTNISEEELDSLQRMPEQSIAPIPMDQKQWSNLTTPERKVIIGLTERYNQNTKYLTLLYALPFIIKDKDKKYVLLPKSNSTLSYDSWVIMDENGKVIKDNISGDLELAGLPLSVGYPDEETNYNRIYNVKDLK